MLDKIDEEERDSGRISSREKEIRRKKAKKAARKKAEEAATATDELLTAMDKQETTGLDISDDEKIPVGSPNVKSNDDIDNEEL